MAAPVQRRNLIAEGVVLTLICLFCVFPFYWMVTTSLKTQVVALQSPPPGPSPLPSRTTGRCCFRTRSACR